MSMHTKYVTQHWKDEGHIFWKYIHIENIEYETTNILT